MEKLVCYLESVFSDPISRPISRLSLDALGRISKDTKKLKDCSKSQLILKSLNQTACEKYLGWCSRQTWFGISSAKAIIERATPVYKTNYTVFFDVRPVLKQANNIALKLPDHYALQMIEAPEGYQFIGLAIPDVETVQSYSKRLGENYGRHSNKVVAVLHGGHQSDKAAAVLIRGDAKCRNLYRRWRE